MESHSGGRRGQFVTSLGRRFATSIHSLGLRGIQSTMRSMSLCGDSITGKDQFRSSRLEAVHTTAGGAVTKSSARLTVVENLLLSPMSSSSSSMNTGLTWRGWLTMFLRFILDG